ncbi:MAG: cupin domain-containing protein [Elusimicrobiota bacterium]
MKTVEKPWGKELWFVKNEFYLGKIICVNKGSRLSKQYHNKKHETFFALKGRFILELNDKEIEIAEKQTVTIEPGNVHRVYAPYEDIEIIEISTPEHDDIVRLEDDFGRITPK